MIFNPVTFLCSSVSHHYKIYGVVAGNFIGDVLQVKQVLKFQTNWYGNNSYPKLTNILVFREISNIVSLSHKRQSVIQGRGGVTFLLSLDQISGRFLFKPVNNE